MVAAANVAAAGDFSQLQLIVHPAYHYWGLIDLGGKTGVPAMHAMMSGWRDALSDFSIGNEWMLAAEGNRVLFKWRVQVRGHVDGPKCSATQHKGIAEGVVLSCWAFHDTETLSWQAGYLYWHLGEVTKVTRCTMAMHCCYYTKTPLLVAACGMQTLHLEHEPCL